MSVAAKDVNKHDLFACGVSKPRSWGEERRRKLALGVVSLGGLLAA
jgi:hypothetical protein